MINRRHFIASAAGLATVMAAGMMRLWPKARGRRHFDATKSSTRWDFGRRVDGEGIHRARL